MHAESLKPDYFNINILSETIIMINIYEANIIQTCIANNFFIDIRMYAA